jgi:pyridoxine 5-phosphate synthase
MNTTLSVNVNKVALVRNTRHLGIPSVARAAEICLQAGAHGITVHPRPDGRHIRTSDVDELADLLQRWPDREFNIEGNPTQNLLEHVHRARPAQCTFVPDSVDQFTSDHGWNLADAAICEALRPLIAQTKALGVRVSLFLDPDPALMTAARAVGADRVELYTEPYAAVWTSGNAAARAQSLAGYAEAARAALHAGLAVNAGHDLNRDNLPPFLRAVPGVVEVSIGHALIADALELGYVATVRAYLTCIAAAGH